MRKKRQSTSQVLGQRGQALIRIVIASYFIAGALGFISGVNLSPLFVQALPASLHHTAPVVGSAAILILAALILSGHWLRPAALLLSIALFWSSYLEMLALGVADNLGQFWRDLALIGALMLTYAEPDTKTRGKIAKLFMTKPKPRQLGERVQPRRVGIERDRTYDPIRFPTKRALVATPVPGPEPVFFTRRNKPVLLNPELKSAPDPLADESNIFIEAANTNRAS